VRALDTAFEQEQNFFELRNATLMHKFEQSKHALD